MMPESKRRLIIGFIVYGKSTAKYLPHFLASLKMQKFFNYKIIAFDNSEADDNANADFIKKNYPAIEYIRAEKNLGFAKAYNIMIARAAEVGADYFLAVNPDMIFEPEMAAELIKVIAADEKIAAAAPKILKWDFVNNQQTNIIDSYGLSITKQHRFSDLHQGEIDNSDFNQVKEIFGFTGAAVLFRVKALSDVAFTSNNNPPLIKGEKKEGVEYFDELMFMYKEDCDLSYRLRLAGWEIVFVPEAVAYHDRLASPKGESNLKIALNRRNKSRVVKKWSFLNQWILWLKYKNLPFSFKVRMGTWWYQVKSLVFVIFFEQYLLSEFFRLFKIREDIKKRREQLKIRVSIKEIERFME